MAEKTKPWDQRPGEPDAAYARFLAYRNLGPSRSLERAYALVAGAKNSKGKQSISGQWGADSTAYDWRERAVAWDVENLATAGRAVVTKYVELLDSVMSTALEALTDGKLQPTTYDSALEAVRLLSTLVNPDAPLAAYEQRGWAQPEGDEPAE